MPADASHIRAEAILKAAFVCFSRYGFRRTSMEDIARETGVSRASLYQHFRNKEEIFRSLCAGLQEKALVLAEQALKGEAPLAERVEAAIAGKVVAFLEVVEASPHGEELVGENSRLCADLAVRTEARFQRMLVETFRAGARSGEIDLGARRLSAPAAAELLRLSAYGLKHAGGGSDDFRKRLHTLIDIFFAGLGS